MNESIETTGPDVDSAVTRALSELGVSREDCRIDILEEPGRRLLGLGTRQARVRVTVVKREAHAPSAVPRQLPEPVKEPVKEAVQAVPEKPVAVAPIPPAPLPTPIPTPAATPAAPPISHPVVAKPVHDYDEDDFDSGRAEPRSAEELDREAKVGAEALQQILNYMQLGATVSARRADTDGHEEPHWLLEIQGQELGALIGHRGETLAALQYVTRLIASKGLERRANIVIDVEGYKSRRETMLRRLAKRMAEQAIERGRTVSLEPMPPHERRIIHLALRDNPAVTTESVGDGEKRKVTIVPRKKPR